MTHCNSNDRSCDNGPFRVPNHAHQRIQAYVLVLRCTSTCKLFLRLRGFTFLLQLLAFYTEFQGCAIETFDTTAADAEMGVLIRELSSILLS